MDKRIKNYKETKLKNQILSKYKLISDFCNEKNISRQTLQDIQNGKNISVRNLIIILELFDVKEITPQGIVELLYSLKVK